MTRSDRGADRELTAGVVRAASRLRWSSLSAGQRDAVERLLVDGCGVMLAGQPHPPTCALVEHVRELGCAPAVSLPSFGLATAPQEAALLVGAATHALDFEPMFSPPTHAVSPVLGAVLALAKAAPAPRCSGEQALEAFAAGVTLQAALRLASTDHGEATPSQGVRHFPFHADGFHLPGILGVLGSALSAAMLLGLDEQPTARALGIAASRAAGIAANIGTMSKALHSGNAARAGVESALLAARGFTGSERVLEAPSGWIQVFGGAGFDQDRALAEMEHPRCLEQPGFAFKRWPAPSAMQVAIAAALPLHEAGRVPSGKIAVAAPQLPYCDRPWPEDGDAARFSFQLSVALALLDGEVTMGSYEDAQLGRASLRELLGRIELTMSPSIPRDFSRTEVRVELADGRCSVADRWPGHWKSPATPTELREKFLECAGSRLGPDAAAELHDRLLGLGVAACARASLASL